MYGLGSIYILSLYGVYFYLKAVFSEILKKIFPNLELVQKLNFLVYDFYLPFYFLFKWSLILFRSKSKNLYSLVNRYILHVTCRRAIDHFKYHGILTAVKYPTIIIWA